MSVNGGGYLPRRSGSVNIHRYSPPLRRIIVKYCHYLEEPASKGMYCMHIFLSTNQCGIKDCESNFAWTLYLLAYFTFHVHNGKCCGAHFRCWTNTSAAVLFQISRNNAADKDKDKTVTTPKSKIGHRRVDETGETLYKKVCCTSDMHIDNTDVQSAICEGEVQLQIEGLQGGLITVQTDFQQLSISSEHWRKCFTCS